MISIVLFSSWYEWKGRDARYWWLVVRVHVSWWWEMHKHWVTDLDICVFSLPHSEIFVPHMHTDTHTTNIHTCVYVCIYIFHCNFHLNVKFPRLQKSVPLLKVWLFMYWDATTMYHDGEFHFELSLGGGDSFILNSFRSLTESPYYNQE